MIFNRFKVLILSHPDQEALIRSLESVKAQTVGMVDVCVVDRGLQDPSILEPYAESWKILSPTRGDSVTELQEGLAALAPTSEDITLIIEGCNQLYNKDVLGQIQNAYLRYDILFTYSQYLVRKTGRVGKNCLPDPKLVAQRSYRKKGWPCYGLRTFKGVLLHKLRSQDLLADSLEPSLFYPMLEMAGPRIQFLPEIHLLVKDDPIHCPSLSNKEIRKKPKYPLC